MRFQKGAADMLIYPLTEIPKRKGEFSRLVNPMIGKSHGLEAPTMPGDAGFDAELYEVVDVRLQVVQGVWPVEFMARHHPRIDFDPVEMPAPLVAQGLSIDDPQGCANVVHMDMPTDMPFAVLAWLLGVGAKLKKPTTEHADFLGHVPYVIENVTDAVKRNLIKAFEAKYYFGRPRPEEVSGLAPDRFTAYFEGCPCHPAYPAGHGAAAASVKVFYKMFDLSEYERKVVFDTAYHWSMYRTFAGVHYANDNLAGLQVGGLL